MVVATEEILTKAQRALDESQFYDIRVLQVEKVNDDLRIFGAVRSYYYKQQAQEVVRVVAGGLRVINDVAVHAQTA